MDTLYLAWTQRPRGWWPVGRLTRTRSDYMFDYTKGALSAAQEAGFRPLPAFPDFAEVYFCAELFPFFSNRLLRKTRPDYQDFIGWLDLGAGETDPMVVLGRSGGRRETDMYEVFAIPEPRSDGLYEATFFVERVNREDPEAKTEARHLATGQPLLLLEERQARNGPSALGVYTTRGVRLGLVPRRLWEDLHALRGAGRGTLSLRVRHANQPPAPAEFRVLCHAEGPPQGGFGWLTHYHFDPIQS